MMDYRILTEKVYIDNQKGNSAVIYNSNDVPVKGFSIVTEAGSVYSGEKDIRIKKSGKETIAVFDLAPGEKLVLQLR
jgi:hypothetical protein